MNESFEDVQSLIIDCFLKEIANDVKNGSRVEGKLNFIFKVKSDLVLLLELGKVCRRKCEVPEHDGALFFSCFQKPAFSEQLVSNRETVTIS